MSNPHETRTAPTPLVDPSARRRIKATMIVTTAALLVVLALSVAHGIRTMSWQGEATTARIY